MAHITLSQLTTVLQRIVSWALSKFAVKNTDSGKLEYADMPVVVLASMGSELDGTSTQRPMSAGSTYYLPAGQGAGARIMFMDSIGRAVKISDPVSGVIYCNAYTDLLYRWDVSEAEMVPVGGTADGDIDVSGKADMLAGTNMLTPTQWPKVVLRNITDTMLDDLASDDVYFDSGHLYLYKGENQNTVDLGAPNSKTIYYCLADGKFYRWHGNSFQTATTFDNAPTQNSTNAVKSGGVYTALAGKLGTGDVSVETPSTADGTFTVNVGSNSYTVNLNHTHENMAKLVVCEESDLPSTLATDTIYAQVDDAEDPSEIQSLWIAGLQFVGGSGSEDDGMPKVTSPNNGSTLNLGENSGSGVSKSVVVRAKNLDYGGSTTGLTIEAIGTGLTLSYGQQTGQSSITIPQTNGVVNTEVTVAYSGSGALDDGELRFKQGNSVLAEVGVVVSYDYFASAIENKAMSGTTNTDASMKDLEGYCVVPDVPITAGHEYKIRFGVSTPPAIGSFVISSVGCNSGGSSVLNFSYLNKSWYRTFTVSDSSVVKLMATFNMSTLDTCYLYDITAGKYVLKGTNANQELDT